MIDGEIANLLDELDNAGNLNDWEVDFLDSMLKHADDGLPFTVGMLRKVRQIHQGRCS